MKISIVSNINILGLATSFVPSVLGGGTEVCSLSPPATCCSLSDCEAFCCTPEDTLVRGEVDTNNPRRGGCGISGMWYRDVYTFPMGGTGPRDLFVSLCSGAADFDCNAINLYVYQAPGGTSGPFDPDNPCNNLVLSNDVDEQIEEGDFCPFSAPKVIDGVVLEGEIQIVLAFFDPFIPCNYDLHVASCQNVAPQYNGGDAGGSCGDVCTCVGGGGLT